MIEFNINDNVQVQLTDFGRKVHREQWQSLKRQFPTYPDYRPPQEDADGWSTWQMWELMRDFGSHIGMGGEEPFVMTIRIEWEPSHSGT